MKICDIIEFFKSLDLEVRESNMPNFINLCSRLEGNFDKDDTREEKSYNIYINGNKTITIYDSNEVYHNNVKYYDPDYKHYYYTLNYYWDNQKIYHENDLDVMFNDLLVDMYKTYTKDFIRDLKIKLLLD